MSRAPNRNAIPVSAEEAAARGWRELDVILVTGDAYVDHPAFGAAVIARVLEAAGFRVGVIPQPDWRSPDDFRRLGRPRLFFGVTAGNLDSMVNHYTAFKQRRRDDAYSPAGRAGLRPDRAAIVYAQRVRQAYRPSGDPKGHPPFGPEGPQGPEGQDGLKGRAEGQGEELEEYAAGIQVGRRPIPILLVLLYVGVGIAVIAYVLYIWRAGLAY